MTCAGDAAYPASTRGGYIDPSTAVAYARQAGFSGQALTNIVAIMIGESSFGAGDINNCIDTRDLSIGLTQVNLFRELSAGRIQELQSLGYNVHSVSDAITTLQDPLANLRMAYKLSNGGTYWNPWIGDFQGPLWDQNLATAAAYIQTGGEAVTNPGSNPGTTSGGSGTSTSTPTPNTGSGGGGSIPGDVASAIGDAASSIGNAITGGTASAFAGLKDIGKFFSKLGVIFNPHFWERLALIIGGILLIAMGARFLIQPSGNNSAALAAAALE